tara:strand:+ start:4029 stop:4997 length:969 start_codon:yes stop_codon:yes gene_type:complete
MINLKSSKITFCPGPGAVINDWFTHQNEYFGRGDTEYSSLKRKTLNWIKKKSGQDNVIPVSGSGTTAAIVALNSFLTGKVLIINTGYYAKRWINYVKNSKLPIKSDVVSYEQFILNKNFKKKYNWIIFVYVETANCRKYDIQKVSKIAKKFKAKIMMDATASIGLENNHKLADVVFFSSCKGLLGPTGLGFVAFKNKIKYKNSKDFWFNLETHKNSKYTLGYNCIASLHGVKKNHELYKRRILYASRLLRKISVNKFLIPKIGVPLKFFLKSKIKSNQNLIFYKPRENPGYEVIFLLGIIKYNKKKIKEVLDKIIIKNLIIK